MTALERARTVVETWEEELRRELPENAYLFDVHTHLGNDIDGMVGSYDELSAVLDRFGFEGAFMFCLDEHDREPAFTVPNDRTLAHAERSQGRLVPFVRLDLTTQPLEEARRCLDLGARYAKQRVTFGAPLSDRQAVQFMLADIMMEHEIGQNYVYRTAWRADICGRFGSRSYASCLLH